MTSVDASPASPLATHMDAAPLLSMRGITKTFPGVTALEGVDLTVRAGTVHALCGENGAGKSTLMNVLAGLVQPDAGEVSLAGDPVRFRALPRDRAGISMIQQELHPVPARSVMENIWLGRFPRGRFGLVDHDRMRRQTPKVVPRYRGGPRSRMPRRVTCRSPRSSSWRSRAPSRSTHAW